MFFNWPIKKSVGDKNITKKLAILVTTLFSLIFLNTSSLAADATVEMLNKQGKESMVYSQKIVKIILTSFISNYDE